MNKLLVLGAGVLIVVTSWYVLDMSKYLPPSLIYLQSLRYESQNVQKRIAGELKQRAIPHRIAEDGAIEYRKKDHQRIRKIADRINLALAVPAETETPPPNIYFSAREDRDTFIELFEGAFNSAYETFVHSF